MKLLEKGNNQPREWRLKVECVGSGEEAEVPCHSLLEIRGTDIVERTVGKSTIPSYGFECCVCHSFTRIRESVIPDKFKRKVVLNHQRESER